MADRNPVKPHKASPKCSGPKDNAEKGVAKSKPVAAKDDSASSSPAAFMIQKGKELIQPLKKKISDVRATPSRHQPSKQPKKPTPVDLRKSHDMHQVASRDPETESDGENEPTNNKDETDKGNKIQSKEEPKIEQCAICMDDCNEPKRLHKCGHVFCKDCIDHYFRSGKPQCPCCFTIYGEIRGNQPDNGKMTHTMISKRLPGFENNSKGTFQITYVFPNGYQDERHPNPGVAYEGTMRVAYLPNNPEGQHVLKLLEKAFKLRQTFTIGQSRTTGSDNVVTWNDIHHKTSVTGGMANFGYPDKTYLNRVQQELAAKGIE